MQEPKTNNNLEYAWSKLNETNGHIFLTGNAGTGKSTLIRKFIKENEGEVIVCAPTGIAATNIGGVTIHNFFHFPARPINKDSIKWLDQNKSVEAEKKSIILRAKYLIIDEISMVRADIMDQIDWFFKKNFPTFPNFAGLKIIMIGDLDQLPPVVSTDEEKRMISTRFDSEFFFSAKCWQENKFNTIKLTHIFRQSDPIFINFLNDIKNNTLAPFDLEKINHLCVKDYGLKPEDGVMLCSTNAIVNEVNNAMIDRLDSDLVTLEGIKTGSFENKNSPVEEFLKVKIGCRIMTMRNDIHGQYFNGSIGILEDISEDTLKIKLDNGNKFEIERVNFETIEYIFDEKTDKIKHTVTGSLSQFPIKISYALTIHRSQGQTFEKVIIDLGDRGAFAHGQTYVALSRCTTLAGLTLRRPLKQSDLIYNKSVLKFNKMQL